MKPTNAEQWTITRADATGMVYDRKRLFTRAGIVAEILWALHDDRCRQIEAKAFDRAGKLVSHKCIFPATQPENGD